MDIIKRKKENQEILKITPANEWGIDELTMFNVKFDDEVSKENFDNYCGNIPDDEPINLLIKDKNISDIIFKVALTPECYKEALTELKINKVDTGIRLLIKALGIVCSDRDYAEANVDSFVKLLLDLIDFTDQNCSIVSNITTNLVFGEYKALEVIPDVSVVEFNTEKFQLITCEDKRKNNPVLNSNLEAQAIAQVIAAYQTNIRETRNKAVLEKIIKYQMPFITVKGGCFNFYLVSNMSKEYLTDLEKGIKPKTPLKILTIIRQLYFKKLEDRIIILKLIYYFRNLVDIFFTNKKVD